MKKKVLTYMVLCCMGMVLLSGCKKKNDDVTDTMATESVEMTVESTEEVEETTEATEETVEATVEETAEATETDAKETEESTSDTEESDTEDTKPSKEPEKEPEKEPSKEPEKKPDPKPEQKPSDSGNNNSKPDNGGNGGNGGGTSTPTPTPQPEAHVHSYSTVSKAATCTEAGYTEEVCSCGDKRNHVDIPKGEHNYVEYWLYYPTCLGVGYHWYECSVCAHYDASRSGEVPPIDHSIEEKVVTEGNCIVNKKIDQICTVCNLKVGSREEPGDASKHDWLTGTGERWDDDAFAMVQFTRTYCTRCGLSKEE